MGIRELTTVQLAELIDSPDDYDLKEFLIKNDINGYIIANIKPELKRQIFPSLLLLVKFEKFESQLIEKFTSKENGLVYTELRTSSLVLEQNYSSYSEVSSLHQTVANDTNTSLSRSNLLEVNNIGLDVEDEENEDEEDEDEENIPKKIQWSGVFDFGYRQFSHDLKKKLSNSSKKLEDKDIDEISSCVFKRLNEYEFKEEGYPGLDGYSTAINAVVNEYKQLSKFKETIYKQVKHKFKYFRNTGLIKNSPIVKAKKIKYTNRKNAQGKIASASRSILNEING